MEPEHDTATESQKSAPTARGRRRRGRWLGRALLGLIALAGLAVFGVLSILKHLDDPPVSRSISAWLHDHLHIDLTWDRLRASPLSDITGRNLRVATPAAFAPFAPTLASLGGLEVHWHPEAAVHGRIEIDRIDLHDLALTVVMDETGATSFDPLLGDPTEPPTPLSKRLEALPAGLEVRALHLDGVTLTLIEVEKGRPIRTTRLSGLELDASADTTGADRRLELTVRSPNPATATRPTGEAATATRLTGEAATATRLTVDAATDAGQLIKELVSRLETSIQVSGQTVQVNARADLVRQSLTTAPLGPGRVLELNGTATFEPDARRTEVVVDRLKVLEDGLYATASVSLADAADGGFATTLRSVSGTASLTRLLPLMPLPEGVALEGRAARFAITDLELDAGARPTHGALELEAELGGVAARVEEAGLAMQNAQLELKTRVTGPLTFDVDARLPLTRVVVGAPGLGLFTQSVATTLEARELTVPLEAPAHATGRVAVRCEIQGLKGDAAGYALDEGDLALQVASTLSGGAPFGGDATLDVGRLKVRPPKEEATSDVSARRTPPPEAGARRVDPSEADARKVRPSKAAERLDLAGARLEVQAHDLVPGEGALSRGTGGLSARFALGLIALRTDLQKGADDLGYDVSLEAPRLDRLAPVLEPFLPTGATVRWDRLGVKATAHGTLAPLSGAPMRIDQASRTEVSQLAYRAPDLEVKAASFLLEGNLKGTSRVATATTTLTLADWRVNDFRSPGRLVTGVNATADRDRPRVELAMNSRGSDGLELNARLAAAYRSTDKTVTYDAAVSGRRLSPLFALASALGIDTKGADAEGKVAGGGVAGGGVAGGGVAGGKVAGGKVATTIVADTLTLSSHGRLAGVIDRLEGGTPVLDPAPAQHMTGDVDLQLELGAFRYRAPDLEASLPGLKLTARSRLTRGAIEGGADLDLEALELRSGADRLSLEDSHQHLSLSSRTSPVDGALTVALQANAGRLAQTWEPLYPAADLRLDAAARIDHLAAMRIDRFVLESTDGGSRLELTGAVDQAPGRETPIEAVDLEADGAVARVPGGQGVALAGALQQDLGALRADPRRFRGSGRVSIPFRLESPDHEIFQLSSSLELKDVDVEMPDAQLRLSGATGRVGIEEEFRFRDDGSLQLLPLSERNPYVRASFADLHPFLTGDSFVSLEAGTYQSTAFGPAAGNLRIDHNVVRLDQLQMQVKEGTVTGQMLIDYLPGDTLALFRGTASGLMLSKERERLDANLALTFSPDKLELNGRAHIVQIGRQTLLDFLDVWDPYHADASFNRVRQGLSLGYPRFVRLGFDHGFMAMKLELGGAASKLRIDEMRGIATGPILNTYVAPYFPRGDEHE